MTTLSNRRTKLLQHLAQHGSVSVAEDLHLPHPPLLRAIGHTVNSLYNHPLIGGQASHVDRAAHAQQFFEGEFSALAKAHLTEKKGGEWHATPQVVGYFKAGKKLGIAHSRILDLVASGNGSVGIGHLKADELGQHYTTQDIEQAVSDLQQLGVITGTRASLKLR
ncbi:MAG: hypothetical protein AABW54_03670 [Candidatus Micrarchaeota archaeon]